MFRRLAWRLSQVTLPSGTILKGVRNPRNPNLLLNGVAVLPDGRAFSGNFDEAHGFPLPGSQLEEDGDLYKGSFNEHWQRDGDGEAWLADGTHYKGRFHKDELVEGVVRIPNGTQEVVFEGTLKDESFLQGKLSQEDFTYEGEFQDNQPHGKGRLVFASGGEQEGTFFKGKLHGVNCKMKLDGGFVYVGEFLDGNIRSGTLYTSTYTYEGEFNEHGRAHGEGTQTYLNNDPRLSFTGIWNNGALVRGTCVDEYGTPVDWQENHDLQQRVLSDTAQSDGEECTAMHSYCLSKLKEADQMHKQMNQSYVQDAETVRKQTGKYPSKTDLGYESGLRHEIAASEQSSKKQMEDVARSREAFAAHKGDYEKASASLKGSNHIIGEINENMAKIQFTRQLGAQQLAAERVDEQFERFMKTFERPLTAEGGSSMGGAETTSHRKLNIDGNEPWKSFTPSSFDR
ncbi:unnamed protein product [Phytomonas sp. EM1]|nr:unnamed protein product [Phytomonas sp. EM1]|eukprot:CCW59791.1 unnamed protein product [Phytomonas sp. isolate EM1]